MTEKKLVIDGLELHYEGLFDLNGLFKAIDEYSSKKGYGKSEKRRQEIVKESGKEFSMEFRPTKVKTDHFAIMIKIRLSITKLEEVEVMKNKVKTKLNKGNVNMIFDAWTSTDYAFRWEKKPGYYFLMTLVDRLWKNFHSNKFHGELIEDTHYIYNNIKAYLNLHRY